MNSLNLDFEKIREAIVEITPIAEFYSVFADTGDPFKIEVYLVDVYHFDEDKIVYFEDGPLKGLPDYTRTPVEKVTVRMETCWIDISDDRTFCSDWKDISEGKTLDEAIENAVKFFSQLDDLKKFLREWDLAPKRLYDSLEEAKEYGSALKMNISTIRWIEKEFEVDLDHLIVG